MIYFLISVFEQTKMTQGYFYTLSAIAQAFAAIVALNAVFVIYKLQLLKNQQNELIMELRRLHIQERGGLSGQVNMWTDLQVLNNSRGIASCKKPLKRFNETKKLSENIAKWLKITLVFNVVTIIQSLVFLPWGGLLPDYLKSIILTEILFFALLSLLITVHAILITLESGKLSIISKIFKE